MKSTTPPDIETLDALDNEAATWFARLQAEPVPVSDRMAFERWLNLDASHGAAWTRYNRLWSDLSLIENDPLVAALRADARGAGEGRASRPDRRAMIAAAAVLVVALGAGAMLGQRWIAPAPLARQAASADPTFTTGVGQQAAFRLKDGSLVTLSTDSAVKVDGWGRERRLSLLRGQAYFEVAKDRKHPFVVTAGDKRVTAVGTAFDVRLDPGKLSVTLVEGRVRIAGPSPRGGGDQMVEMNAGSRFTAPVGADWRIAQVDAVREASWLQGRVVFDGQPLSTVVDEMNRYSTRKLRVADARLGATPVSGVFKTGQVDAFVAAVESYGLAKVGRADDRQVVLVRP
ncbi:MAG: anti-FecI sigma factor, FecR [Caulobacter sp.]|nr:anti-FecI sigma factor, FecR [Caulobacter sp.]